VPTLFTQQSVPLIYGGGEKLVIRFREMSLAQSELFCSSGRPLSSSRSRSSSSASQASLSSLSSSGESEHLYRDIASDISSASSPAASPVQSASDKPKAGEYVPPVMYVSWLRGTVVEHQSLTGELSLSCARPVVDG